MLVCAQFQQPTQEELTMRSEPKAPGAAAVYLNIEESYGLEPGIANFHVRIKVLTEKGKALGTVEIPYREGVEQVALIKGRTIHPDGTSLPLTEPPQDLPGESTNGLQGAQYDRKVFTLPSVKTGSILEYSYQIRGVDLHDPASHTVWRVQRDYFIHKEHYELMRPSGGTALAGAYVTSQTLPAGAEVKQDAAGLFSLDVTDVLPIPGEAWMPPLRYLTYQVHFYYADAANAEDFWSHQAGLWSEAVKNFAAPSKTIQDAVDRLVAAGDSDTDKAKKLYAAVQKLENAEFSHRMTGAGQRKLQLKDAWRAEDAWKQKSGSGNELALLYLAMLRAAGLTAYAMEVADRDRGIFNPRYAEMDQLDSFLVILKAGDNETYLDPGVKMCPFGMLSWKHTEAGGMRESAEGSGINFTPAPPYTQNTTLRTGDLNVDAKGAVSGNLQFTMKGQAALRWRQEWLVNGKAEVYKQFDRELEAMAPEGVTARLDHFVGLEDPNAYLIAMIDVKGTLGAATDKRLVLPGFFLETRGDEPFIHEETRQAPIDMHYDEMVTDQIVYHLPAGMTVEGAPADAKELWKDHAVYNARFKSEPGQVTAARTLARAFTLARVSEYPELRGFYQKVAADDQVEIVVTARPEAKAD
jgi:hypothetical protein